MIGYAEEALERGRAVYPEDAPEIGMLYENLAWALKKTERIIRAKRVLQETRDWYDRHHGKDSVESAAVSLELAELQFEAVRQEQWNWRRALRMVEQALESARSSMAERPGEYLDLYYRAAEILESRYQYDRARSYRKGAYELAAELYPAESPELARAAYQLGAAYVAEENPGKAKPLLHTAFDTYKHDQSNHRALAGVSRALIYLYASSDDREAAERECARLAGELSNLSDQNESEVLLDAGRVATPVPLYPARADLAGVDGRVVVRFAVTAMGETERVKVVSSEPEGVFEELAMEAIDGRQYAPSCSNEGLVPVDDMTVELIFEPMSRGSFARGASNGWRITAERIKNH